MFMHTCALRALCNCWKSFIDLYFVPVPAADRLSFNNQTRSCLHGLAPSLLTSKLPVDLGMPPRQRMPPRNASKAKFFWAQPKSENLSLVNTSRPQPQTTYVNMKYCNKDRTDYFGSRLLSSFSMSAIYSFLVYLRYRQTQTGSDPWIYKKQIWIASARPTFWPTLLWVATHTLRTTAPGTGCEGTSSYCCNLSGGVALIVWFTTNGKCVKNNIIVCLARASNSKRDSEHDLYCCLLPRCEALRACRSGFPIATIPKHAL